jgi:multisubunit Na+/H+ antiporter MnhB subunit
MLIALVTLLFLIAAGYMAALFPELLRKPLEAAVAGGILFVSYVLTFLYLNNMLNFTIDSVLESLFAVVGYPIRLLSR